MEYKEDALTGSDKQFDGAFSRVEGLVWLPWVGKNYAQGKHRVLVVAESHYSVQDDAGNFARGASEGPVNILETRQCVEECPIGQEWPSRTYQNLSRVLAGGEPADPAGLWEGIAYYNLVQRVMDYSGDEYAKERPTYRDYMRGWGIFNQVAGIIKPDACIVAGVSAANHFEEAMGKLSVGHSPVEQFDLEGEQARARCMGIELEGRRLPIVCIKHPAKYFSYDLWHGFLQEKLPETMEYLAALAAGKE